LNCGNAAISLSLGFQPPEKHRHRALGQLAPAQAETGPPQVINLADCQVRRRPILDGLIYEYHLAA
jgi:hypothetical protein